MVTSGSSNIFYLIKSPNHHLPQPTTNKLIQKERRTKPFHQVVQISILCALVGQVAGHDNYGHHGHCYRQNLPAFLPLQIIADEV